MPDNNNLHRLKSVLRLTLKKVVFRTVYGLYLWTASTQGVVTGYSERIVEYPFVVRTLLSDPKLKRVLLVGCSGDLLTTLLPSLGIETYGIDVKFVPIVYPAFQFAKDDVRKMKFPEGFFDAVVAVSTIEHVGLSDNDTQGDAKAMREIERVTKAHGLVIITVPITEKLRIGPFERLYDKSTLKKLLENLTTEELTIYGRNNDKSWVPLEPPLSPGNQRAVALIRARKALPKAQSVSSFASP